MLIQRAFSGAKRVFTIVDLLVIIAVTAVLAAIIYPVFVQDTPNPARVMPRDPLKNSSRKFLMLFRK